MTYQPTKSELEELGFTEYAGGKYYGIHFGDNFSIGYDLSIIDIYFAGDEEGGRMKISLESLEDLKTLIRILTPQ